ncbi:MAG: hypothetical protein K9K75_03340 [Deltaproteobacteria bacterium]|nr:hypothetical protein [Deltaproteobacteria bacterium]
MINGQYFHTIDDKGRITVPAKLREVIEGTSENQMKLSFFDKSLILCPIPMWLLIEEEFSGEKLFVEKRLKYLRRHLISAAVDCSLDSLGRIFVPGNLRESAEMKKDVVFVGMGGFIEIWGKERFMQDQKEAGALMSELGEASSNLGI